MIFLHRQFSMKPFSRHYRKIDETILDYLDFDAEGNLKGTGRGCKDILMAFMLIIVKPEAVERINKDLEEYRHVI